MNEEDVKTLDDMASYFFQLSEKMGKPLQSMKLSKGKHKW